MPKLSGIFSHFINLDQISPESISTWLKSSLPTGVPLPTVDQIEDHLANRVLYPQVVAVTALDLKIDLAILREALRPNKHFLDINLKKIIIPSDFLNFVSDLPQLIQVFIDAYLLEPSLREKAALWTIVTKGQTEEAVGSLMIPSFTHTTGKIDLFLEGNNYSVKQGILTTLKCPKTKCMLGFKSENSQFLGKSEGVVEIWGGKLGLVVDTRKV